MPLTQGRRTSYSLHVSLEKCLQSVRLPLLGGLDWFGFYRSGIRKHGTPSRTQTTGGIRIHTRPCSHFSGLIDPRRGPGYPFWGWSLSGKPQGNKEASHFAGGSFKGQPTVWSVLKGSHKEAYHFAGDFPREASGPDVCRPNPEERREIAVRKNHSDL